MRWWLVRKAATAFSDTDRRRLLPNIDVDHTGLSKASALSIQCHPHPPPFYSDLDHHLRKHRFKSLWFVESELVSLRAAVDGGHEGNVYSYSGNSYLGPFVYQAS